MLYSLHFPRGAMRLVWKVRLIAPLGILLLGLTGCGSILQTLGLGSSNADADNTSERIGTQTLTISDEGNVILSNEEAGIELLLSAAWSEDMRLHDSAELQAADAENRLYIIVVAEEKGPLVREGGLEENAEDYRKLLINRLESAETPAPTDVRFIGENFADQYEIRGKVDAETPVVYLHTTVDTQARYYQIVAWTTPEQYVEYRSEMQTITETFRETDS